MGGDHEKFSDDSPEWLIGCNDALHRMLPFVLLLLIGYLFVTFFTDFYHPLLTWVERFVLGYFVIELVVAFILYSSKKKFLKDKWFHILLVLPLFAVFRVIGRVFQVFRGGAAAMEGLRVLQIFEASMLHRLFGGYRIARITAYLAEVQKGLHALVDIPKTLSQRKIKWIISVTGITMLNRFISEDDSEHAVTGDEVDEDDSEHAVTGDEVDEDDSEPVDESIDS